MKSWSQSTHDLLPVSKKAKIIFTQSVWEKVRDVIIGTIFLMVRMYKGLQIYWGLITAQAELSFGTRSVSSIMCWD